MNRGKVYSFSVRDSAAEELALVAYFKLKAIKHGQKFSFFVLQGLKLLKEETDGKSKQK